MATFALAWRDGALHAEWTASGDEPAHFVTGLMVRDYIAGGRWGQPMAFAQNYYDHYPKVAMGHWPPLYFAVEAVWMLAFGPSRASMIAMQSVIAALFLALSFRMFRRWFPATVAWPAAMLEAAAPSMRYQSRALSSDLLVALFVFVAVMCFVRLMERLDWRAGIRFAAASVAAALTKGVAVVLAPACAGALFVYRRWMLLKDYRFWLLLISVVALALPWYLLAPDALHQRVEFLGKAGRLYKSRPFRTMAVFRGEFGLLMCILSLAGCYFAIRHARTPAMRRHFVAAATAIAAAVLMRWSLAVWEPRHMIVSLPFVALFACAGLAKLPAPAAWALAGVVSLLQVGAMPPKASTGMDVVAGSLTSELHYRKSPFLVASDATGEGVFIAGVAVREPRPGHVVERGTKTLGSYQFMGTLNSLKYKSPGDLLALISSDPKRVVVLYSKPGGEFPHVRDLRTLLHGRPSGWSLCASFPAGSRVRGGPIEVWSQSCAGGGAK